MDEIAWRAVPEEPPPGVEPWVEYALRDVRLERRIVLAYLWANWLLKKLSDSPSLIDTAIEGAVVGDYEIADISAGFISLETSYDLLQPNRGRYLESVSNTRYWVLSSDGALVWTFGVVLGVRPRFPLDAREGRLTVLPRLRDYVDLEGFPVICDVRLEEPGGEGAIVEYHAPVNPAGAATSACYVKPRAGKRFYGPAWSEGILIARHVLGGSPTMGTLVRMQTGHTMSVADVDSATTIDAAVLDAGAGAISAGASPMPIYPAIAPGITVHVAGSHTTFTATVLRVMDDPKYFGNASAHRAFLDGYGVSGDSGALVTEQTTGDAVGVYIARIPGPPDEGMVQLMRQVTKYFEIELY